MAARITQESVEALVKSVTGANGRVTQESVEALVKNVVGAKSRVTQVSVEVLVQIGGVPIVFNNPQMF